MTEPRNLYEAARGYIQSEALTPDGDTGWVMEHEFRTAFASLRGSTIDHLLHQLEKHGDAQRILVNEHPAYKPTRKVKMVRRR